MLPVGLSCIEAPNYNDYKEKHSHKKDGLIRLSKLLKSILGILRVFRNRVVSISLIQ